MIYNTLLRLIAVLDLSLRSSQTFQMASTKIAPKIDEQTKPAIQFASLGGIWKRATTEIPYAELIEGNYFHAMMRFDSEPQAKQRIVVEYVVAMTPANVGFDKANVHLSATVVGSPISHVENVQSQIEAIKEPNVKTTISATFDIDDTQDLIQTNLHTDIQSQSLGGLLIYSVTVKDATSAE